MTGHKRETLKEGYSTYYNENTIGLPVFYGRYPYKKRTCKTCLPYVKLEDDTDETFSITYQEWAEIIQVYFKYLCLYLLSGKVYRFCSHMGEFQIQKYISRKHNLNVDFGAMIKYYMESEGIEDYNEAKKFIRDNVSDPKIVKHRNKHTMGFKWLVVWFKKEYKFGFKHHWSFSLSRNGAWSFINNAFKNNRELIYNITESKFSLRKSIR